MRKTLFVFLPASAATSLAVLLQTVLTVVSSSAAWLAIPALPPLMPAALHRRSAAAPTASRTRKRRGTGFVGTSSIIGMTATSGITTTNSSAAAAAPGKWDGLTTGTQGSCSSASNCADGSKEDRSKLQGRLLKSVRRVCVDYDMLEEGDHIMVCVSGGKDSATLLVLLKLLQEKLSMQQKNWHSSKKPDTMNNQHDEKEEPYFKLTAVHVDQKQPGYDGRALVEWLRDDLKVPFRIVEEDTYSVVVDKTSIGKSYCALCSRLRRGILYTTAIELGCNKIALGHHADDCLETLFLNMVHAGQMKAMPARYTAKRGGTGLAVMRPMIECFEEDVARYAKMSKFPIIPCNLCGNQQPASSELHRPQVKLLLSALTGLSPNAKKNLIRSCKTVRPSHLMDQDLRIACGLDPVTGEETIQSTARQFSDGHGDDEDFL